MSHNQTFPSDSRIQLERIRNFFAHTQGNMASTLLAVLLIAIVLYGAGVAHGVIAGWVTALGLLTIVVLGYERYVRATGITAENCNRLLGVRLTLSSVITLLYGISGILLPLEATPAEDAFLFIILLTVITLAALSYAVMPKYFLFIDVLCLFPITTHFAIQYGYYQDKYYLLLIVLSVICQIVILRKARLVSNTAIAAIVLNQRLLDEIEEHERTKDALRHMALHDALTGIGNRRYFEEEFMRTLSGAERNRSRFGLLALDLNGFKPVNDQYGHAAGDALLKAVADRMVKSVRASDFCARVGGDEFSVIVKSMNSADDALDVTNKIQLALAEVFEIDGVKILIDGSIGCAVYPDDGTTMQALIANADRKMYIQKKSFKYRRL